MSEWQWYGSADEECFHIGPFDTREEVIEEGRGYYPDRQFCIAEARKGGPIDLARHLNIEWLIDHMIESINEEHGNPDSDEIMADIEATAVRSLEGMLKSETRRWQELHGLDYDPWAFADMRNLEWITPLLARQEERT